VVCGFACATSIAIIPTCRKLAARWQSLQSMALQLLSRSDFEAVLREIHEEARQEDADTGKWPSCLSSTPATAKTRWRFFGSLLRTELTVHGRGSIVSSCAEQARLDAASYRGDSAASAVLAEVRRKWHSCARLVVAAHVV
jgi:hypothetical protein